jgi:hypothetical protein
MKPRYLIPSAIVIAAVVLISQQSLSIPAFARKYKTSCATCHEGFPKLNPFGEAFRRNGYQFPAHTDAEFTKETPVSLGSEGNKRAFPDAIWPGTIPGSSPIAVFLNGEADYNPHGEPRVTFGGLGSSIEMAAAGTLGEDLSFWGQLALNGDGSVEINRVFLIFSNLIGDNYVLNARVGVIEPGVFSFSTHRAWMEDYWITTRAFSDDMGWTMEETQKGIELNGMCEGRFGYSAGLVEGFGSPHSGKDYYLHATYKFGGLPLDGVVQGSGASGPGLPGSETSLTLGAFVYRGSAVLGDGPTTQGNNFTLVGGDANAYCGRFNLFGGVAMRNDDEPFLGTPGLSASSHVWFSELDVSVFPWLFPALRFESWAGESLDPASGLKTRYTDAQFVPGVVALVRANVKFTLRGTIGKLESQGDTKFQPGQVQLLLAVGI